MNSDLEMNLGTFTLYFLGYDHSGGKETAEEKKESRFNREGTDIYFALLHLPRARLIQRTQRQAGTRPLAYRRYQMAFR